MDVAITELEKIEADRIDGVGMPANGIPVLLLKHVAEPEPVEDEPVADPEPEFDRDAAKALAKQVLRHVADGVVSAGPDFLGNMLKAAGKRGQVDEAPDVDLGNQIIALLFQAIIAEAQEGAAGNAGEVCDIQELACALQAVRCWRDGEQAVSLGDVMPASMLMQSAAEPSMEPLLHAVAEAVHKGDLTTDEARKMWPVWDAAAALAKDSREFSAAERKKHAAEGNALPDGSYPIPDKDALRRAAILARSGHGDVAAAKRLIARRAKELGVANPLDTGGDTAKSQIAPEGTTVDTETQTGELTELVKAADAKAAALEKRVTDQESVIKALEGRLAKVEAAPVLGGPVMSAVRPRTGPDGEDHARKAAYYEEWAAKVSAPEDADRYRQLAAQERAKITS